MKHAPWHGKEDDVTAQLVNALAEVLGVTPSYLMELVGDPLATMNEDDDSMQLIHMVRQMDDEEKSEYLETVRMFLKPKLPRVIRNEE